MRTVTEAGTEEFCEAEGRTHSAARSELSHCTCKTDCDPFASIHCLSVVWDGRYQSSGMVYERKYFFQKNHEGHASFRGLYVISSYS